VPELFHQDTADLAEDARRLLLDLDREVPGVAAVDAECRPAIDVLETATAVEVVVDCPGVPPSSLRIALRRNTLLVVGAKQARSLGAEGRFHLAERSYGHFARAVRISGAIDARKASASTSAGQLRVVLPRIEERRGELMQIPVELA
jgi:HSP20 family protein